MSSRPKPTIEDWTGLREKQKHLATRLALQTLPLIGTTLAISLWLTLLGREEGKTPVEWLAALSFAAAVLLAGRAAVIGRSIAQQLRLSAGAIRKLKLEDDCSAIDQTHE